MTVQKITTGIYKWGFIPALFLLKEEQEKENFENCNIIKQALDKVCKGREWYLSTKVDDISIEKTYINIMSRQDNPKLIDSNMQYYINEFKKSILNN